ncbi:MAG: type II secretion system protein [Candidatus Paceibacterota bacterium]
MFENQKGLTLVELLVVTGIIMILSAVTIPNWNEGGERLKVMRATYQVHQDIRRAQELTLASAECNECSCQLPHGYGIHFEKDDTYDLFGECNEYQEDGGLEDPYEAPLEQKVQIHLEEGLEIEEIIGRTNGSSYAIEELTVNYRPPDPKVLIRDENGNELQEGIIRLEGGQFCRQVRTNKVGLVEISECP